MLSLEQEHLFNFRITDKWTDALIDKAVLIYEQGLGQKYISREDLIRFTENKGKYILIGAMVGEELAGVMVAYPMELHEQDQYDRELPEKEVSSFFIDKKVGLIKSVAVEKKFRRRGIGTQLILESVSRLEQRGCDLFFAVSWKSGLRDSSPSVFEALNFTKAVEISDYWTEDSIKEGYMCPVDGNPCRCSAIFYFKS